MQKYNALYAQSGGVTAVINATACGLIRAARKHDDRIGKVYAARNGIIGALREELIDTSAESDDAITALKYTPAGAFGSCRYKLKEIDESKDEYVRLMEVFKAHNIGYFFYNGGGDSQDTTDKIAQFAARHGHPLSCIGIPKTVDNDLPLTDCCPGFGTTAKYIAVTTREVSFDLASMDTTSTKVFVLEVMGRHAGWIAAAAGLARDNNHGAPHLILFPEVPFERIKMLDKVKHFVEHNGHCVIVASEGIRDEGGRFLSEAGNKDAFGHAQLGGVAPIIAKIVGTEFGYKYHWAVADYMQRSARHIASRIDVEQAYALGQYAITAALSGKNAVMTAIVRDSNTPYKWHIDSVALTAVANREKKMPPEFIDAAGFFITPACRDYLLPLIEGEDYPPYQNGLPHYIRLKNKAVAKKLSGYNRP